MAENVADPQPKNQDISTSSSLFNKLALSIWIACVAVSGAFLILLMTGMLNRDLPEKARRDFWVEVNNQILNALFTLMSLYQHPKIMRHTRLLSRWRPQDALALRKAYCRHAACRPHERKHMTVVAILLHVNFIGQYASCGLFLGYGEKDRPTLWVGILMGVTIVATIVAGAYMLLSPLWRGYEKETEEEASHNISGTIELADRVGPGP